MANMAQEGKWILAKYLFEDVIDEIFNQAGPTGGDFIYNIRQYKNKDNKSELNDFFNDPDTKKRYNLQCKEYHRSSRDVYSRLEEDFMKPEASAVEYILSYSPIKVLVYQGQDDLIVNSIGAYRWVYNLKWFPTRNFEPIKYKGITVGYKMQLDKLQYRLILKAGHYVPSDQPEVALGMLSDLII